MITAAARATTQIEELVREAGRQESRQEGMQAGGKKHRADVGSTTPGTRRK